MPVLSNFDVGYPFSAWIIPCGKLSVNAPTKHRVRPVIYLIIIPVNFELVNGV